MLTFENMNDIIQLKIHLDKSEPAIWRTIQIERNTTFFELHHTIQIVFGWKNYHLYEFFIDGHILGAPEDYMANVPSTEEGVIDARDITLDLIIEPGEMFSYTYDFGDSWKHIITVEKFLPKEQEIKYPICIDGELACPPEDSGGIHGYYDLLEVLKDKKNPEYKDSKMWVGKNFKPEHFDKEKVNAKLSRLYKYIMDWLNQ
jgi:hypothetical protein